MAETLGGAELAELDEQENDNGTPSELPEINSMNAETPPEGWTLNEPNYMARVAGLIEYGLIDFVTKAHVPSFLERLRKAELRRSNEEQDFWTTPDPWIDAWMLLTGRKREVFDITAFVNHQKEISRSFQSLRTAANLRVLSDRCPVAREMERQRRQAYGETSQTEERQEVPSQSHWTVAKHWVPW